jgi:hypothetical protein
MNAMIKYIGGATLATAVLFGSATVAGYTLEDAAKADEAGIEDMFDLDAIAALDKDPLAEAFDLEADVQHEAAAGEVDAPAAARTVAANSNPEDFVIKRVLPIDGPIRYGEWFWDDEGVPDGPLVMTVDLDARVLSVFRAGYEIGASAVLLGTQEHPTPLGAFPILTKERDNVSEKYNNAPMPYTLRLTWDGVAIHGSRVQNGYASHGCVGTPDEFARRLFEIASIGDVVIITRGKRTGVGESLVNG